MNKTTNNIAALNKHEQYQVWVLLAVACEQGTIPAGVDNELIGRLVMQMKPVSAADFKAIAEHAEQTELNQTV